MSGQIIDPNTGQPMNTDGVKNVVGDDELRARQAAEEVRAILDAYDCELFPVLMLSPKGIIGTSVDILPKSRLNPAKGGAPSTPQVPADAQEAVDTASEGIPETSKGTDVVDPVAMPDNVVPLGNTPVNAAPTGSGPEVA